MEKLGLRSYLAKRIIYSFILVLIVIILNFIIFFAMPGDPYGQFIPPQKLTKAQLEALRNYWGYYDPQWLKLVKYMWNLLRFDFGKSVRNYQPVAEQMLARIPYTLILLGGSTVLAVIIGVYLGVLVAERRGGLFDTGAVTTSLVTFSLPTFWMGLIAILIFSVTLRWFAVGLAHPPNWDLAGFPTPAMVSAQVFPNVVLSLNPANIVEMVRGYLYHGFLPIFVLTIFQYGGYLLLTRATMIEALTEDYIVTARAKGLSERTVLFKHALKNASLPIVTSIALSFGFILSGAIITETVFSWPGLGTWIWDAIITSNYPVLMADFYVIAICSIISIFIADLIYGIIDPRIHYG